MKYIVNVTRIRYGYRDLLIDANSEEQAVDLALELAGDYEFSEKDAEYITQGVTACPKL